MSNQTARDALVESHLEYARKITRVIARDLPASVDFEDLEAFGRLGLLQAAERYDPRAGTTFTTFAWYRIRGAVYDGLSKMTGLPPSVRARLAAADLGDAWVESSLRAAEQQSGPTEMAAAFSRAVQGLALVHLASQVGPEGLTEDPVDDRATSDEPAARELRVRLRATLDRLPTPDADLLRALYFEGLSTTDLATRAGVNKSTISRRHARALEALRAGLVGSGESAAVTSA